MYALVDCNNFFVSCEWVFQPELLARPVVVLSNNDGCVVSCSEEAKQMGIRRGQPFGRLKHLADNGQLLVRSGNMPLYNDMSRRVMTILRHAGFPQEIYSIDECFLDLADTADAVSIGRGLVSRVRRYTGISVSVGVATTKTLAKIAARFAKKHDGYRGCCGIETERQRRCALELTDVGDVWGIGRRYRERLYASGVRTAFQFLCLGREQVYGLTGQQGVDAWCELQGNPVSAFRHEPVARKTLTASRSFRESIVDFDTLHAILSHFAEQCADRLRREHSVAFTVGVYLSTDRFRPDLPQYSNAATHRLAVATNDMRELASAASLCLRSVYREGFAFKKAGMWLASVTSVRQTDMFDTVDRERQSRLLSTVDSIRSRMGKSKLSLASSLSVDGFSRHEMRSRRFSTDFKEIIEV